MTPTVGSGGPSDGARLGRLEAQLCPAPPVHGAICSNCHAGGSFGDLDAGERAREGLFFYTGMPQDACGQKLAVRARDPPRVP